MPAPTSAGRSAGPPTDAGREGTVRRVAAARRVLAVALLLVIAVAAAACSSSPQKPKAGLKPYPTKKLTLYGYHTSLGTVVGSIDGVVAYANKHESGKTVVCTGSCAQTWQPWLTDGVKVEAGKGIDKGLIGTVTRPTGGVQMTYGGHPLYLYAHATQALQASGQGSGNVWYVVGTDGKLVT
jgi:predicted lipoprotein with Yx(FWY)xxD motif